MNIRPQTIEKYVRFLNLIKQNEGQSKMISKLVEECGISCATPSIAQQLGLFVVNGQRIDKVNYSKVEPIMARRLIEKTNASTFRTPSPLKRVRVQKAVVKETPILPPSNLPIGNVISQILPNNVKIVELRILGIPLFKYTKS